MDRKSLTAGARPPAGPPVSFFVLGWAWWLPLAVGDGAVERGYALPRLRSPFGPMRATLVLRCSGRSGTRRCS